MRTAGVLAALVVALVAQATLAGMVMSAGMLVNLVLVAVVYAALAFGAVSGLLAGAAGGLAQDALAGGIIGIGGLSKTITGFLVGVLGAQFIVSQPFARFVMFAGATVLHEVCFEGLHALVEMRRMNLHASTIATEAVVNAIVGVAAFQAIERGPGFFQRRSARRSSVSRRRF